MLRYKYGRRRAWNWRTRVLMLLGAAAIVGALNEATVASAQAQQIVYTRNPTGYLAGEELWKANVDGTGKQRIFRHSLNGWQIGEPELSPNGGRVAYDHANGTVYTINMDGTNNEALLPGKDSETGGRLVTNSDPQWTGDGATILYSRESIDPLSPTAGRAIYRASGTGVGGSPIVDWQGHQDQPIATSDSRLLAFTSDREPSGASGEGLYVSDFDGSNARRIVDARSAGFNILGPKFSPDNTRIAFSARILTQTGGIQTDLYSVGVNGGPLTRVTNTSYGELEPDWAPDGSQLIFERSTGAAASGQLWRIRPDGTGYAQLFTDTAGLNHPSYRQKDPTPGGVTTPADMTTYLFAYAPVLNYDAQETYFADSASELTDNYVRSQQKSASYSNKLFRGTTVLAAADPGDRAADLSLGYLGGVYLDGRAASNVDVIDAANSYEADYQRLHMQSNYSHQMYARAVLQSGKWWLQYWFFYYYNPLSFYGAGTHEGDWETVHIGLDSELRPDTTTFSQHHGSVSCSYTDLDKSARVESYGAPIVYVGAGGHANYVTPGTTNVGGVLTERHNGDGVSVRPAVNVISTTTRWPTWPGRWGNSDRSPASPGRQTERWDDPAGFNASGATADCPGAPGSYISRQSPHRPRAGVHRRPRPVISAVRDRRRVSVAYYVSGAPSRRSRRLHITVHSADPTRFAPSSAMKSLRRSSGHATLRLPLGPGPFKVRASALGPGGWSRAAESLVGRADQPARSEPR